MMRVLLPLPITPALVTATTAPMDASPVWSAATAYAKDDLCHRVETARVYRRITAGTSPTPPESDRDMWQDFGPVNRYAMFDQLRSTRTQVQAAPLSVTIEPGARFDSAALLGMRGQSVTLTTTTGAVSQVRTIALFGRSVASWYQFFTRPFAQRESLVLWDLAAWRNTTLTIDVQPLPGPSGMAGCGVLAVGTSEVLGDALWDYEADALNFSETERAFDGSLTLLPRRAVPKLAIQVRVPAARVDAVLALREQTNAVPVLWDAWTRYPGSPYAASARIYGIWRRFSLRPGNVKYAIADIELEET